MDNCENIFKIPTRRNLLDDFESSLKDEQHMNAYTRPLSHEQETEQSKVIVTQDTNEPPNKKSRLENKIISQLREELINVRIKAAEQEAQIREEIWKDMSQQLTIQEAEHSELLRDVQAEARKRADRRVKMIRQEWAKKLEAKHDENKCRECKKKGFIIGDLRAENQLKKKKCGMFLVNLRRIDGPIRPSSRSKPWKGRLRPCN